MEMGGFTGSKKMHFVETIPWVVVPLTMVSQEVIFNDGFPYFWGQLT